MNINFVIFMAALTGLGVVYLYLSYHGKRKRCANCKFFHLQREHKYLGNCGRNYLNTTCLDWEECKHWKPRQ